MLTQDHVHKNTERNINKTNCNTHKRMSIAVGFIWYLYDIYLIYKRNQLQYS